MMETNKQNLTVLDRDADPEFYFENLSDDELTSIIENLNDFDDASNALSELSLRNNWEEVIKHSVKILEENLGDEFLQASAFNLLYTTDVEKAVKIIEARKSDASPSLLGEIMNNLASNSLQPFENSLPKVLFKSIADRYSDFDGEDQERISDDFEYFMEKYENKFS